MRLSQDTLLIIALECDDAEAAALYFACSKGQVAHSVNGSIYTMFPAAKGLNS